MDYTELAKEFLRMLQNRKAGAHGDLQEHFQEGTRGESFILHRIIEKGELVPGELSGAMGVSSARVAAALNNLERKGFITREIDLNDRRRIIVKPTAAGAEFAERTQITHVGMFAQILSLLGEDDAREFVRIMCKLMDAFSKLKIEN